MQTDKRFNRFSNGSELIQFAKTEYVIYTRVSTKEQLDNNVSLDSQLKHSEGIHYNRENDDYRTTKINLLFSAIPYLMRLVARYKNGDSDFSAKIPTWVVPLETKLK
jgi:hypothetical protein